MHELDFDKAVQFIFAGRSVTTFQGATTRYTFKINKVKPTTTGVQQSLWFINVLTGPSTYTFIGTIRDSEEAGLVYKHSRKSKIGADAPSVKALSWIVSRLSANAPHPNLKIFHEGHCGRCGRSLTTPESITLGIGPECIKRMN